MEVTNEIVTAKMSVTNQIVTQWLLGDVSMQLACSCSEIYYSGMCG